mgnify:FL=1
MSEQHPAKRVSLLSREYVHSHNKAGWLGLFSEDAIIEDPIGISPIDEAGKGHRGVAAREAFWENNIANSDIKIVIHQSYAAGLECANIVTLNTILTFGGKTYSQEVNGIFTYQVNEAEQLVALRGYWEVDEMMKTIKEVVNA